MKRGRPRTTWKDEVEEDLSIMGIKGMQAMARGFREWRNGAGSQGSKKECDFVEVENEE